MSAGGDEQPYAGLDPDAVLAAVESLGLACDGRLLTLNSYENRVYRVGLEDAAPVVAKFYRPGRWSDAAIAEEHAFTVELAQAELPVVPPMERAGTRLHRHADWRFALFPVVGGRAPEPDHRATLELLGRTLGRLHAIGAGRSFQHRPRLDPLSHGRDPIAVLLAQEWLPAHLSEPFQSLAGHLLAAVERSWQQVAPAGLRLHGDFHLGNLLLRDDRLQVVDFDDTLTGPAVQDLWMLLSGDAQDMRRQLDWLLSGYTRFHRFDSRELALVEPMRTLRLLHFNAWIARRWHDPAFPAAFPWFAEPRHWEALIGQLHEQLAVLQEPPQLA
jgi:Ser/Thr protein kinase RdoA (MazF antagonist)